MAITPLPGKTADIYFRDKAGIQELVNKLSSETSSDMSAQVAMLKTHLDVQGGNSIDLEDLLSLLETDLGMSNSDAQNIVVELNGFSDDLNNSESGKDEIVKFLKQMIDTSGPNRAVAHNEPGEKKKAGALLISSNINKFNDGMKDVDKSMSKAKSSFEVMSSTVDSARTGMTNLTDVLEKSSESLGATSSTTSGYMSGFSTVLSSGTKGLMAPFAALAGGLAMAVHAIGNFQAKLDIGRSYGSAGGGETMVEQLRQLHVSSLIDPKALNDLSQVMSKSFNVGLGMNQKEMTRVATKQRLSERVMGKEYADDQMAAINEMKTVLDGQSPSGMMDDLTAQTSALAKTMGVSNKYALEQIKAIHNNSKALTKGMNSAGAKDVEATFAEMLAQQKAAGYTKEYSEKHMETVSTQMADKGEMAKAIQRAIQVREMGGAGAEAQEKLLAEANISSDEMMRVMTLGASVGQAAMSPADKKMLQQVSSIQIQSEEFLTSNVQKNMTDKSLSDEEREYWVTRQATITNMGGMATSNETANKDINEVVGAKKTASAELKMNRASADAAPAVDKLLVAMSQQAGNSKKSKQELEAMLTKNMMDSNPDKKAEIEAAKEKKIQFGMKKSKMGRKEYMASLGASQKEALISKKAKKAGMSRGDFLATLDNAEKAALETEGNTMAMNQLNFDSMTTVMGESITESVGKMEKGVKNSGIAGVKASHLQAVVQSPDYENNRVKLVSNPVEKAADKANRLLIEANNAMERGMMQVVNKAIPYLMTAMDILADNIREIAAGAILLLGGMLALKAGMMIFNVGSKLFKGVKFLGKIFGIGRVKKIDKGASLISRIFKRLGKSLIGIHGSFEKISKGFLKVAKAPFTIVKKIWDGGKAISKGFLKVVKKIWDGEKAISKGFLKVSKKMWDGGKAAIHTAKELPTKARTLGTKIIDTKSKIGQKITNITTKGSNVVTNTKNTLLKIKKQPKTTLKNIGAGAKNLGKKIINATGSGGKAVATKMQKALSITTKLAKATSISSKAAVIGTKAFGTAGSAFTKFLGPLGLAVTIAMAGKAAYDGWNNAGELLGLQAVKSKEDAIKLGAALDENGNAMRNASGEFTDESGKVIRQTASVSQQFSAALGGAVSSLSMGLIDASASAKWFDTNFGETWVHIGKIWDNIVAGTKKLWDDVKVLFGPAMESLGEVLDDFKAMFINPFKAIMALFAGDTKSAKNLIGDALTGAKNLLYSIPKFLGDSFNGVFDLITSQGKKITRLFTEMIWEIEDWWDSLKFSEIWESLKTNFVASMDNLGKIIGKAVSGMMDSVYTYIAGLTGGQAMLGTIFGKSEDEIQGYVKKSKEKEKAEKDDKKIQAVQEGKIGKDLIYQLADLGLGDNDRFDSGLKSDTANVTQEAVTILSDKQLKSIIEAGANKSINLSKESKKIIQEELHARGTGLRTRQSSIGNKKVTDIKVEETLENSIETNTDKKSGKKTIKDFSMFKDKTQDQIFEYLSNHRKELSKETQSKLLKMTKEDSRDTDAKKAARAKTIQRKKERAQNKKELKSTVEIKSGTDSQEVSAAKVSVGASGSDSIIQKAKDGLSSFGDSISSTFDNVMGKANIIAKDGFGNVVAAIKGTNYTGGTALASNGPVMSNNTLANATVNKKMNMTVGSLSAKYEARGSGTVSTGKGDKGGVSYGTYQMKSEGKNGGVVGAFMKTLPTTLKKAFQDSSGKQFKVNSPEFKKAWKETAKGSNKKEFAKKQHDYIKKSQYDRQVRKVGKESGVDLTKRSKAVQNVAWSTSVQHGGDTTVIVKALEQLKKDGKKDTDENLIKAIYAERGKAAKSGGLARFGGSSAETNNSVKSRYNSEEKDALSMLKTEEAMGKYVDPKTAAQTLPANTKDTVAAVTAVVTKDQISTIPPPNTPSSETPFDGSAINANTLETKFTSMVERKSDDPLLKKFLKGITRAGEEQSAASLATQQAMAQFIGEGARGTKKGWKNLDDEQRKRVKDAYLLFKKQEKATLEAQKTNNNNGSKDNASSTASAVSDAVDTTTKRLVSQSEGSQMAKDLTDGLTGDQRKEAEAKMKELGIDMKWATDKAASLGRGQTGDSEVDMKQMEKVKNILALIKGTKTKKQVALETGHDSRMTNVSNTFATNKMETLKTEDLTGNVEYTKKRDALQKRLDAAKKAKNYVEVDKIKEEQKVLEATDGAKEDHKLDGKRKIKALMDAGKIKEAQSLTKEVYKDEHNDHMQLEEKKYIGEVAGEQQIANGRKKAPIVNQKKTVLSTAVKTDGLGAVEETPVTSIKKLKDNKTNSVITTPNVGNSSDALKQTIQTKPKTYKALDKDDPLLEAKRKAYENRDRIKRKAAKGTLVEEMYEVNDAQDAITQKYKPGQRKSKEDLNKLSELGEKESALYSNKNYREQDKSIDNSKEVLEADLKVASSSVAIDVATGDRDKRRGMYDYGVSAHKSQLENTKRSLAALPNIPEASKVREMKNVEVQKVRAKIDSATKTAKADGVIDSAEKLDLSKMESLLTQILNANTTQAIQAVKQNTLIKDANAVNQKSHQMNVNKVGQ